MSMVTFAGPLLVLNPDTSNVICPDVRPGRAGGTTRLSSPMACSIPRACSPVAPTWRSMSAAAMPGRKSCSVI